MAIEHEYWVYKADDYFGVFRRQGSGVIREFTQYHAKAYTIGEYIEVTNDFTLPEEYSDDRRKAYRITCTEDKMKEIIFMEML